MLNVPGKNIIAAMPLLKKRVKGVIFAIDALQNKMLNDGHSPFFMKKKLAEYSHHMIRKIDNDVGRQKYNRRFGIIEPVFANISEQKRMDRFLLRSKSKVNIQWTLYCIVHNIEKILNFGAQGSLASA